jgi:hypothetical protein
MNFFIVTKGFWSPPQKKNCKYACMLSVEPVEGRGSQQAGKRERKKEKEKRKIVKHTWAEREDTTLTAKLTIYVLSHLLLDATKSHLVYGCRVSSPSPFLVVSSFCTICLFVYSVLDATPFLVVSSFCTRCDEVRVVVASSFKFSVFG